VTARSFDRAESRIDTDMLNIRQEGSVAVLTIDRPARRNSICVELVQTLRAAFRRCDGDPQVKAIVLTGVAPGFCAGSDLKELATLDLAGMSAHEGDTAAMAREIALLETPVVAAVDGFALGGGFVLAASCDVVVTARTTRWHLPEVTIGWIPPWGIETLIARLGPVTARRLTWGSEALDGVEAHRVGVADYLAAGDVVAEALAIAGRLAALPAPAVAATKRYFSLAAARQGEAGDAVANRMFIENCGHEVAKSTLKKFGVKA
jgi:enoyl-CoA hydratase/carnithine racemase